MREHFKPTALKFMPSPVESPQALLSLGRSIEQEAARRYLELAASMRLRDETRLAALFDFLASIEEKHAVQITERAARGGHEIPASPMPRQPVPESFDAEAGESTLLTPYRALAIAVRNEMRAFAFYSYLAATAPNASVRELAEEMAKDELAHADLLRRERRKAYRAQKTQAQRPLADLPETLPVLWSLCFETETRAARYHRALAERLRTQDDVSGAAFSAAAEDEENCAREAAAQIGKSFPELAESDQPTVVGGRRLLEEAFERYSDIAGRSEHEEVMQQALSLAERASRRLFLTSLELAKHAR